MLVKNLSYEFYKTLKISIPINLIYSSLLLKETYSYNKRTKEEFRHLRYCRREKFQ